MKSHITIPNCVLKRFALNNNGFYKYDVKRQVITRGHPRSTFTEEGYYSDRVENIMSDAIEARLSKLYKFANEMMDDAKPLTIPSDIYEIAIDYFRSLIARSPILAEAVSQRSALIQCVNIQTQHDMVFYYAMQEETMFDLIDRMELSFMINETDTPFVLLTRGLYEYEINNVLCINAPIGPKISIMLKEKGKKLHTSIEYENVITILPCEHDDVVMKINSFAMHRQKQDGIGYLVCHDKTVLERLI